MEETVSQKPAQATVQSIEIPSGKLLRESRRIHFIRAAIVGCAAGIVAVAFRLSLQGIEAFRDRLFENHQTLVGVLLLLILCPALVVAARWLVVTFDPQAAGSGIPQVKGALLHLREISGVRVIPIKFLGGILALGAGLSLGREGPTVQMGAGAGDIVSRLLRVPKKSQRHLIACGAGAGLAAAFNAPLAGFLFVIEELQRELSPITYGTAFIAAITADAVTRVATGQAPDFSLQGYPALPLSALPVVLAIGAAGGIVGVLFNHGTLWGLKLLDARPPKFRWIAAAAAGVCAVVLWFFVPSSVGSGHATAQEAVLGTVSGSSSLLIVLVALLCKFAFTLLSYFSGVPGGIFSPLLTIGALMGLAVGIPVHAYAPEAVPFVGAAGIIGMAALFTGIVRAPITGIVLILEMTANHEQIFALAVASLVAYMVAEHFKCPPIYEALLDYDLKKGGAHRETNSEPLALNITVEPGSAAEGKKIRELSLPAGCLVVAIDRRGEAIVPSGETVIEAADQLNIFSAAENSGKIYHEVLKQFRGE